jgi:hypothetical protein
MDTGTDTKKHNKKICLFNLTKKRVWEQIIKSNLANQLIYKSNKLADFYN